MKIKKKLRDLTPEEYANWHLKNCYTTKCDICPFESVICNMIGPNIWVNNKDLYSDKFLNQEIEIEVFILTDKEKEYLRNVIKPFRNRVKYISKQKTYEYEYISICNRTPEDIAYCGKVSYIILPYFERGTMYNNMKVEKQYTLEDLGL